MIAGLPNDILLYIFEMLDFSSAVAFQNVFNKLKASYFSHIRKRLAQHTFIKRNQCVHCKVPCISELQWNDNTKRDWIPWCVLHTDSVILQNVDLYCIGSFGVEGFRIRF